MTATAFIREAGLYALAVCNGEIAPRSDGEEAEFQRPLWGAGYHRKTNGLHHNSLACSPGRTKLLW